LAVLDGPVTTRASDDLELLEEGTLVPEETDLADLAILEANEVNLVERRLATRRDLRRHGYGLTRGKVTVWSVIKLSSRPGRKLPPLATNSNCVSTSRASESAVATDEITFSTCLLISLPSTCRFL